MAESSEDIESGSHRLISPLCDEKETSLDKKLRNFAFKVALIEKAASTLGTMNFIWATVVLLGGFSQSLKSIDFWFVSVILVVEGLRIICRHGELATRRSRPSDFSLALAMQEYSATACIVLSSLRIHKQQYGSDDNQNRNRALNLFYCLSTVESILTLSGVIVRFYFRQSLLLPPNRETSSGRSIISKLLDFFTKVIFSRVVGQCWSCALHDDGFDDSQFDTVLTYFYDTYCRCINGSVFDGLKMDFLSYSVELLQSIGDNEQLEGARLLFMLLKSHRLRSEKLRAIGTTPGVLERLIELLNCERPHEQEIRRVAGEIIYKLVEIPGNRIRVMAIPESMESMESLLYDGNHIGIHRTKYPDDEYNYSNFSVLGLWILKILANNPDNRAKIGKNKGLLRKIIELLNPNASESEIIKHLESLPMDTVATTVRENNNGTSGTEKKNGTSGFEAEHSDDPNLQSF